MQWKELPSPVSLAQPPAARCATNHDAAAALNTNAQHISSQRRSIAPSIEAVVSDVPFSNLPPLITSPLVVKSLQDSSPAPSSNCHTAATARPAPSSPQAHCFPITADSRADARSIDAAPGQQQLPIACYAASAIRSVVFFCAAAIILVTTSKFGINPFGNATASLIESLAVLSNNCLSFYAAYEPKISLFLLFLSSFILAAAARSSVVACTSPRHFFLFSVSQSFSSLCLPNDNRLNALNSASVELRKAKQEREHALRLLQSAAAARVNPVLYHS